jgi:hypothetical protein
MTMKRWLIALTFLAALSAVSQAEAGYRWCRRPVAACYPPVAVYPVPVPVVAAYRFPVMPPPMFVPVPAVAVVPVVPTPVYRWNYFGPRYFW